MNGRSPTPLERRRVVELATIPWLGYRRIARCLGLSLHQVRQAIAEDAADRLDAASKSRCSTCGGLLLQTPCVACAARGLGTGG